MRSADSRARATKQVASPPAVSSSRRATRAVAVDRVGRGLQDTEGDLLVAAWHVAKWRTRDRGLSLAPCGRPPSLSGEFATWRAQRGELAFACAGAPQRGATRPTPNWSPARTGLP